MKWAGQALFLRRENLHGSSHSFTLSKKFKHKISKPWRRLCRIRAKVFNDVPQPVTTYH